MPVSLFQHFVVSIFRPILRMADASVRVAIIESIFLYRTNWEKSVEEAKKRNSIS